LISIIISVFFTPVHFLFDLNFKGLPLKRKEMNKEWYKTDKELFDSRVIDIWYMCFDFVWFYHFQLLVSVLSQALTEKGLCVDFWDSVCFQYSLIYFLCGKLIAENCMTYRRVSYYTPLDYTKCLFRSKLKLKLKFTLE